MIEFTQKIKDFINRRPRSLHVLVGVLYLLFTFYYMTPQMLHCTTTVYGFGDNTAGPIWHHSVNPGNPLGGPEKITNYPFGENLYSPASYSASLQYGWYWGLAKVAGPICGYNLLNIIGFVASALTMYGFVYSFSKKRWIAVMAGYVVAFSPYFQVKVGGHMGYGYEAILIGTVWAFYNLFKRQRKKDGWILGLLIGVCGYWDPYFSLLVAVLAIPLVATWLVLNRHNFSLEQKTKKEGIAARVRLKSLGLALIVAIILLIPLAVIKVKDGPQINSFVTSSRGNILYEARACSILPYEYGVPFVLNPVFSHLVGQKYYHNATNSLMLGFKCGIGEDSISISWVVLGTVSLGLIVFGWEALNRRKPKLNKLINGDYRFLFWGALAGALFAAIMALPPVKYHGIPSPAYVLLQLTDTWRTLARLYVLVNMFYVILFSIFLIYFADHFKKNIRLLKYIFIVMFLIMFAEYQAFPPLKGNTLSNFNYKKDTPAAYMWIAKQDDIKSIAEYPLERLGGESEAEVFYQTMQATDHKALFNSALPNSPQDVIRDSIKDISDPQTVPVLRALGIDAVVIHGVPLDDVKKIAGLQIEQSYPESPRNLLGLTPTVSYDNIVVAKVIAGSAPTRLLELNQGFPRNTLIIHSAGDWEYEAIQDSTMTIGQVSKTGVADTNAQSPAGLACFDIKMASLNDTDQVVFNIDGKNSAPMNLNDNYQRVRLMAAHSIKLHNKVGHNMRVQNLGCSADDVAQGASS